MNGEGSVGFTSESRRTSPQPLSMNGEGSVGFMSYGASTTGTQTGAEVGLVTPMAKATWSASTG